MPEANEVIEGVSGQDRAGTPFVFAPAPATGFTDEALETLELDAVLELVAARAAGPLGAARVRSRRPTDDVAWIAAELAAVGEVAGLFRRGDRLLAEAIPEVDRTLARLRIPGSVLEGPQLAALQRMIGAARRVHADLRRVAETAPRAAALARAVPEAAVERRLEQSVGPDGGVLDTASPRLAAARREVHAARQRLIRKLEGMLRALEADTVPTGATVTVRAGRYVIPVRRDSRHRPGGIVHDESGSAGTLFVEPADAIELGNALREAEIAEERETLRVLRDLTEFLRPLSPLLHDAVTMCVAVDDLVARARYAADTAGEVPELAAAPAPLVIRHGRHPLLLGTVETVVPFDLELAPSERTLLISGPNTGGKTVLLKAVGLAAALAQSGVVPPVGPGSRLPVFRRCYADIGDRQSITASLSTFSAHVRTLRRVLDDADDATLVLLDEIGSGTDPAEGAALAAAALVSLTQRGALTLATTHLGSLKELASQTAGVVNASLEFDAATLTPTYRFHKGVPGRSYGLAIARRLGVAPEILADAEARVPAEDRNLDALLAAAEERDRALRAAQAALDERMTELERLRAEFELRETRTADRETELLRRERTAERQGRQQARTLLLEARQQVETALGAARAAVDEAAAREARRLLEGEIRAAGEQLAALDDSLVSPAMSATARPGAADAGADTWLGARVRVPSGQTGVVLELRPDGKAVVGIGALRMVVEAAGLVRVAGAGAGAERRNARAGEAIAEAAAPAEPVFEVDFRGMTGDEAEQATIAAVDAAVLAEQPYLRIIHGKGTGVVRERVRQVIGRDRRVARFGFAAQNQGGTGVTVVEFSGDA